MLNLKSIKKLFLLLNKAEQRKLFWLTLASVFLSLSEALGLAMIIPIMNLFIEPQAVYGSRILTKLYNSSGAKDIPAFIVTLVVMAFFLFIFKAIYTVSFFSAQQKFVGKVYARLSGAVLASYLYKPYAFHLVNNSSVLFKNVNAEVGQFTTNFLTPVLLIGSELIVLLGIFAFLVSVYPAVTLILFITLALIIFGINRLFKRKMKLYAQERESYSGQIYKNALESLHAVKEIKVFNAYSFFLQKFIQTTKKYTVAFVNSATIISIPRYLFEMILVCAILGTILFSVFFQMASSGLITMMAVFGLASLRLLPSVSKIFSNINLFHYAENSLDIIYGVLRHEDTKSYRQEAEANQLFSATANTIELKDVTFYYEPARAEAILENLSLTLPLRHTIALVGSTGSGKSTLIDIIMGLLEPTKGELYYCGRAINQTNLLDFQNKIGYVPQNIYLLDDTIWANIAFGMAKENLDYQRLNQTVRIAQLESFIKELPQGLDTQVGERGMRISGGQKQRIGIARALYRNPEILILDEATSALDGRTELELYTAIKNLLAGITVIFVTHRLTTLEQADIIHVIEKGRVVESGRFLELSKRSAFLLAISKQEVAA